MPTLGEMNSESRRWAMNRLAPGASGAGPELVGPVDQVADLPDPGLRELPVVLAGEGAQQATPSRPSR